VTSPNTKTLKKLHTLLAARRFAAQHAYMEIEKQKGIEQKHAGCWACMANECGRLRKHLRPVPLRLIEEQVVDLGCVRGRGHRVAADAKRFGVSVKEAAQHMRVQCIQSGLDLQAQEEICAQKQTYALTWCVCSAGNSPSDFRRHPIQVLLCTSRCARGMIPSAVHTHLSVFKAKNLRKILILSSQEYVHSK
jgi:hypothetical protein